MAVTVGASKPAETKKKDGKKAAPKKDAADTAKKQAGGKTKMTKAELLSAAKLRVRKSATDNLDTDVERHIDTVLADLERIGVKTSWLAAPTDPLIIEAVLSYVKANYSIADNYDVLIGVYNMVLTKIKGTSKYFTTDAPEPEATGSEG